MLAADPNVRSPGSETRARHRTGFSGWIRPVGFVARWASLMAAAVTVAALLAVTLPGLAGYHNLTITGGSMGSALPVGSVAVTRTIDIRDVRVGDVIAFNRSRGGVTIVHRVVAINQTDDGPVAVTRGDANSNDDADGLLLQHAQGDRVVYHVPWIGYVFVFAQSPGGIIALTIVGVAIVLFRPRKRSSGTEAHATPSMAL